MSRAAFALLILAVAGLASTAALLIAGPLTPPGGAVVSSYKTLAEVEPRIALSDASTPGDADSLYRITAPGSYYLTAHLNAPGAQSAIEIASGGVDLDLSGFSVSGDSGSLALIRLDSPGPAWSLSIRNGSIGPAPGRRGVDVAAAEGGTAENLRVSGAGSDGLRLGSGFTVRACAATNNGGSGIRVAGNSVVVDSVAADNGLTGITTGVASTIRGCTAASNAGTGIVADVGSVVEASVARANTGSGIQGGFHVAVRDCSVVGNGVHGVDVANGSSVVDCNVNQNSIDGVRASFHATIRGNNAWNNGTAGATTGANIRVTGTSARVEGNSCVGADIGVAADSAGNVIIRNTARGNATDWVFVAGNVFGPIVDRRSPGTAAVSGFSAADSTATTHPNANISY